jgi:uncharacterized protein (TIGR03437 family)
MPGNNHAASYVIGVVLLLATFSPSVPAQRVVSHTPRAAAGYTLVAPVNSPTSYLLDRAGKIIHRWQAQGPPGLVVHLLANGRLLRTATTESAVFGSSSGSGGRIELYAPDGALLWTYTLATNKLFRHHDIAPLPNGNVLLIAWELYSASETIAAGRNPERMSDDAFWSEAIFEIEPTGKEGGRVVWEWHVWDHMVQDFDARKANYGDVAAHPELMDINYGLQTPDWLHFNAIAYNSALDQVVISSRTLSEIWVIDHSTTTAEAATHSGGRQGKGGDILYRWGNPQVYRAGTAADQRLFDQHNVHWIDPGLPGSGNLLIFSNGRTRGFSTVEEVVTPVDGSGAYRRGQGAGFGPAEAIWSYGANADPRFVSRILGGVQRLPNGNTLVCVSTANRLIEVTPEKEVVWDLDIAELGAGGSGTFRAVRFPPSFEGLRPLGFFEPAPSLMNAASRIAGPFAPASLVSVLDAPCDQAAIEIVDRDQMLHPATVISRANRRIDILTPADVAIGPGRLTARCAAMQQDVDVRIDRVTPALFTANGDGVGVGAIIAATVSADGFIAYEPAFELDPVRGLMRARSVEFGTGKDTYLMLFGTGVRHASSIEVRIGGQAVPVSAFGSQLEFAGLDQINVGPIPERLRGTGQQPIVLHADGRASNPITVSFR